MPRQRSPPTDELMRQVSPVWYSALDATTITVQGNLAPEATAQFVAAVRAAGAKVVPSIVDQMPAGGMAAVLADPASRAAHVAAIADLAATNGFDGIDIDYEQFAFADDRATWPTTRPLWIDFVTRARQPPSRRRSHAVGQRAAHQR